MGVVLDERPVQQDGLEEYTERINTTCIALQSYDKEEVIHELAFEALTIIKNMKIEDAGDALLYCASLNLLNTYVKQRNSLIGYSFKDEIHYMTSILLNLDLDDVYIDYHDSEVLLVVQIFHIQFSFHYVKKKQEIVDLCNSRHYMKLEWDGVRKQMCATTLYNEVRKNKIRVCNITYRGKLLEKKIERMLSVYKEGKTNFKELIKS